MSDCDALLAAILADPAEDTPRLAYADWCEENAGTAVCPECHGRPKSRRKASGVAAKSFTAWKKSYQRCQNCKATGRISDGRRERAEFIRVQVELARLPAIDQCGHKNHHQRVSELRDRIQKLWDIGTYCGGFLEIPAHWGIVYWRRGFIESTKLSWSDWHTHADVILRAQPIERVKLTTSPRWRCTDGAIHYGDKALPFVHAFWPRIKFDWIL